MPDSNITVFFTASDPAPVARPMTPAAMPPGWAFVSLPGSVALHGPADQIRAWLQSGLDALADGSVKWTATGAEIVPEHPSVNHGAGNADLPRCGAEGGNVAPGEVTCPLCLKLVQP